MEWIEVHVQYIHERTLNSTSLSENVKYFSCAVKFTNNKKSDLWNVKWVIFYIAVDLPLDSLSTGQSTRYECVCEWINVNCTKVLESSTRPETCNMNAAIYQTTFRGCHQIQNSLISKVCLVQGLSRPRKSPTQLCSQISEDSDLISQCVRYLKM